MVCIYIHRHFSKKGRQIICVKIIDQKEDLLRIDIWYVAIFFRSAGRCIIFNGAVLAGQNPSLTALLAAYLTVKLKGRLLLA